MDERILRLPDVKSITGLSRSLIYKMIADGTFPQPLHLGARAVGWLASEIFSFLKQKAEKRETKQRGQENAQ